VSLSHTLAGRNREADVFPQRLAGELQAADFSAQALERGNRSLANENRRPAGKNPEGAEQVPPADSL
jgi:hypothetical protein